MEVFLNLNGFELSANVDEQEALFLRIAAGEATRQELEGWLDDHTSPVRR
jgi:death-on-curing protein